jgi:hypothetical protein
MIRLNISGVYNDKDPNEFKTYDYDTIYRNTISRTIEGFGSEHDRTNKGRVLIFNPKSLAKTAKQYDVSKEVQEKLDYLSRHGVMVSWPKNDENITNNMKDNDDRPEESENSKEKEQHDTMTPHDTSLSKNNDMEPNGGNWTRKGLTQIFTCDDCGLESFQFAMEEHKCPAWTEEKQRKQTRQTDLDPPPTDLDSNSEQKPKSDRDGEWLLDK